MKKLFQRREKDNKDGENKNYRAPPGRRSNSKKTWQNTVT
jgi:hypothetical protein